MNLYATYEGPEGKGYLPGKRYYIRLYKNWVSKVADGSSLYPVADPQEFLNHWKNIQY